MKNRSFPAQILAGLLLATAALSLTACGNRIYLNPTTPFAGRTIPPSGLLQRVMAAYTTNGTSGGGLEILDGLRDLRSNVQNTIPSFFIKGFSAGYPISIINYPEQQTGYVLSYTDGSLIGVNYSTEASTSAAATFAADIPSVAAAPGGVLFAGAVESAGVLGISGRYGSVSLNLPNVDKVVTNPSATIVLAMVRNSNQLYRVVKLPATNTPTYPPGYIDCQPILLPTYCVVPVGNTSLVGATAGAPGVAYDHPADAIFSSDGTSVYILNCGPECGGIASGVTVLQQAPLLMTTVPTQDPLCGETNHPVCAATEPNPLAPLPGTLANPIAVPGGVTVGLSDGTNLYLAGQELQTSGSNAGLYAGNLSILNLTSYTVGTTYPISDGTHTKMLFADNGTLWIGAQNCANGVRAANAANGVTDQTANTNCLTRVVPNYVYNAITNANPASILPVWTANTAYQAGQKVCDAPSTLPQLPGSLSAVPVCDAGNIQVVLTTGTSGKTSPSFGQAPNQTVTDGSVTWINMGPVTPVQIIPMITPTKQGTPVIGVMYPNTNLNNTYYGNLYGEAWVQNYGKIYTSYGGQIHAFLTEDGFEINNYNITIQGTVLDVAYMDAESNSAD